MERRLSERRIIAHSVTVSGSYSGSQPASGSTIDPDVRRALLATTAPEAAARESGYLDEEAMKPYGLAESTRSRSTLSYTCSVDAAIRSQSKT